MIFLHPVFRRNRRLRNSWFLRVTKVRGLTTDREGTSITDFTLGNGGPRKLKKCNKSRDTTLRFTVEGKVRTSNSRECALSFLSTEIDVQSGLEAVVHST